MDELSVTSGSAYYSRVAKAARAANQNEFRKVTKFLDKWKTINSKTLGREEAKMKNNLMRIKQDKARYASESNLHASMMNPDGEGSHANSSTHIRDRSTTPDQDVRSKLFDYEKRQARSRRQLQETEAGNQTPPPQLRRHTIHITPAVSRTNTPFEHSQSPLTLPNIATPDVNHGEERCFSPLLGQRKSVRFAPNRDIVHHSSVELSRHRPSFISSQRSTHQFIAAESPSKFRNIYDKTIESVENADIQSFKLPVRENGSKGERRASTTKNADVIIQSKVRNVKMDEAVLRDLEELLKDAKLYTNKKLKELHMDQYGSTNRTNRKRIEYLEQLLSSLRSKEGNKVFDPESILQCKYLRLSTSNIEHLEQCMRNSGVDPGIHSHSVNYNIDLISA